MDEYIDRQALIDELRETDMQVYAGDGIAVGRREYLTIEEVVDIISGSPAVSQWILCSDRLPDVAGQYLVAYHPCYWDDVRDEAETGIDSFRGKGSWAKKKYQRVFAWMPLPAPPKEE